REPTDIPRDQSCTRSGEITPAQSLRVRDFKLDRLFQANHVRVVVRGYLSQQVVTRRGGSSRHVQPVHERTVTAEDVEVLTESVRSERPEFGPDPQRRARVDQ